MFSMNEEKIKKYLSVEGNELSIIHLYLENKNGEIHAENDGYYDEDEWTEFGPAKYGIMKEQIVSPDEAIRLIREELQFFIEYGNKKEAGPLF